MRRACHPVGPARNKTIYFMSENQQQEIPEVQDSDIWDEFWHGGNCGGSIVSECPHGITFFHDDVRAGSWNEGELEQLRAQAISDPQKVIARDGEPHYSGMLSMDWHWDCKICRAQAVKYQDFIWANRHMIAKFLNAKLEKVAKDAAAELASGKVKL